CRRLEWADRVSREPEAAVFSEDDDAVRLLTIHASKGLDFRVVIIPEVGSHASAPSNLPLILSRASQNVGSAMGQPTLATKGVDESGRTHDLPSHRAAMSEERRRSAAERHRLLYVAVTRASERLFFVGNGKAEGSLAATLQELILDPSALLAVEEAVLGPPPVATTTPSRSVD